MESVTKVHKIIYPIANYGIRILFSLILFGLCLQSMFSTGFIGKVINEDGSVQNRTFNIADSPVWHLLIFLLCIVGMVTVKRLWHDVKQQLAFDRISRKITTHGALKILYIITGMAGCIWILATQLYPISDPEKIYEISMQWRKLDFSSFVEVGYLFRYPYQSGIVLFYYLLSFLFGTNNFIVLQLVNVPALIFIYYYVAKLAEDYWKDDKEIRLIVYIALAVWFPLFFYITYLYGILIGMALSLAGVSMSLRYLKTRRIKYMFIAALCIGLATVFKMNCLIYMVAICCYLVYDIIVTSEWKNRLCSVFFVFLMILSVKGLNQAVYSYVEHLSGYEMPDGEVMLSWVAMGLQESPNGPGSYNGYIGEVFEEYHYDTEKITEASIAEIKKNMKDMLSNWYDKGLPFFARKNAFQWNDPTFRGVYLSRNRSSNVRHSDFVESILTGEGSVRLSVFLNCAQTLILLGAFCCVIARFGSRNLYELFGGVIFLGGYLFHFFWEASASYTIPYFIMLIPYAVKGFLIVAHRIETLYEILKYKNHGDMQTRMAWRKSSKVSIVMLLIVLLSLSAFARTNIFANTIALNDGDAAAEQFYHERQVPDFLNGYYTVSPYLAEEVALTEREGNIQTESVTGQMEQKVAVVMDNGYITLRFRNSEKVAAVLPEENNRLISYIDDDMNFFYDADKKAYDKWTIQQAEKDCYFIVINGLALTYDTDSGQVFLKACTEKEEQKWVLR